MPAMTLQAAHFSPRPSLRHASLLREREGDAIRPSQAARHAVRAEKAGMPCQRHMTTDGADTLATRAEISWPRQAERLYDAVAYCRFLVAFSSHFSLGCQLRVSRSMPAPSAAPSGGAGDERGIHVDFLLISPTAYMPMRAESRIFPFGAHQARATMSRRRISF